MKKNLIALGLVLVTFMLVWVLIGQFKTPMEFQTQKDQRVTVVAERLKDIRVAQRAYRSKYNRFVSTFDSLITFIKTDSLEMLVAIGNEDDSLAVANKKVIRIKSKIAVKDSIYNTRLKSNPAFKVDSIRYIPFSVEATGSIKEFTLGSSTFVSGSGVSIPIFQAYASYADFLGDLDKQEVINFRDEQINTLKREDGLCVGSLKAPNNEAGNWE